MVLMCTIREVRTDNPEIPGKMGRMSTARTPRTAPFIASGIWPDAVLRDDAPRHVERVQATCRSLRDHLNASGESVRSVAARAEVAHTTVTRVLRGETWCDVATLAALEDALGKDVWVARGSGAFGHGGTQE